MTVVRPRIADLGERELILRIQRLTRTLTGHDLILDDAAPIQGPKTASGRVWVTVDPAPVPNIVQRVGMGSYYHAGWLAALKSLSDLAAVGATPNGLILAAELPSEMPLSEFDGFFSGVLECAREHGTVLVGGNLRETQKTLHCVSIGFGTIDERGALRRGNVEHGDVVFLVTPNVLGGFWAGIAAHRLGQNLELPPSAHRALSELSLRPRVSFEAARALLGADSPRFTMDSSDGIFFCVREMIASCHFDAILDLPLTIFPSLVRHVSQACGGDPRTWALSWGDYHLVCAGSRSTVETVRGRLDGLGAHLIEIGTIMRGSGIVRLKDNNRQVPLSLPSWLCGEQFGTQLFWGQSLGEHVERVLSISLNSFAG